MVSAGASPRLLIEYPEKQRREVLDYLFKLNFGAGFQHLKVEIGGEVNSTDGIELTHMRSRDGENFERGYALLLGRVTIVPQNDKLPNGYAFKVSSTGDWELRAIRTTVGPKPWNFKITGDTGAPLAQGHADFAANSWHQLELSMMEDAISVRRDGKILATVLDSTHSDGQVGLGSDWSGADFARFSVRSDSLPR